MTDPKVSETVKVPCKWNTDGFVYMNKSDVEAFKAGTLYTQPAPSAADEKAEVPADKK